MTQKEKIKFGLDRNHGINRDWAKANLIKWNNIRKRIYEFRQQKIKIIYDKIRGYVLKKYY